jgi:hypothetical protein
MGDVYRDSRTYREREWERDEGASSDDERYRKTTIRRYKVTPSRSDRYSEYDDGRSHVSRYAGRPTGDFVEQDRRSYAPDRPHSAFEPAPSQASFREDRGRDTAPRSFIYEKEIERETYPPPAPPPMPMPAPSQVGDRTRAPVYAETKEVERDWERRSRFDALFDDDVKVENQMVKTERRDNGEYRVEKRVEEHIDDSHGCDVERYRKETEYYTPYDPPPPVIIRQRAPEPQKIIVQEAPAPPPVIVSPRQQQQPGVVVIREKEPERQQIVVRREHRHEHRHEHRPRPQDEEYYYRHEHYDSRGDRRYVERYDRRGGHYSDDEDYYMRRKVVRRRESSEDSHHRRHLAEGALAGAGVTALLNSRRDSYGELPENRGRKVIAGAALGALGTEALRRAKSAYEDRWHDEESPDRSSRFKQGLGIAAVALAAAGAAKYYQSNKIEKEEAIRGRSRGRRGYHSDDYSRSRSRSSRSVIRRTTTTTKSTSRGSRRRSLSTASSSQQSSRQLW